MKKVVIYTHDLVPGMEHLIPWRVLIEMATHLKQSGYEVKILSGISQFKTDSWEHQGVKIFFAPKPSLALVTSLNSSQTDLIFWPVTWFVNKKSYQILSQINAIKLVYFPGGIYKIPYIIRAFPYVAFKNLIPYFIESIFPKKITIRFLQKYHITHVISFTELTAKTITGKGLDSNDVSFVYPGFDELKAPGDDSKFSAYLKPDDKYILFMGSASPIRGSLYLLDTIKRHNFPANLKFVFLIRTDVGVSQTPLFNKINKMGNPPNCLFITEKLSKEQLYPFIVNSHAVVLPFLIIPSEVPVTFYEVLNIGKPVITLENGGTTDHLKKFIYVAGNTKKQLADQITDCLTNEAGYYQKIQYIENDFKGNFTWKNFTNKFKEIIQHV